MGVSMSRGSMETMERAAISIPDDVKQRSLEAEGAFEGVAASEPIVRYDPEKLAPSKFDDPTIATFGRRLGVYGIAVYASMMSLDDSEYAATPRNIAAMIGSTESRVRKSLERLQKLGVISLVGADHVE